MSAFEPSVEILCVGTELLLGHVTNTNARDISEMLSQIGMNVRWHTVVGDNPNRLRDCARIAAERADIILTTGGLGPTCDDITKQVLAEALGVPLVKNEEEDRCLRRFMEERGHFTENMLQQALLPEGCTVFHNTCGTAPGCAFTKNGVTAILLPGPPKECRAMMKVSVLPYLRALGKETIVSHSVRIFGIGESGVDDLFAEEMNRMTNPSMAPYPKECDCLLQITAKAETEEAAEEMCRPVMRRVIERLGDAVYGTDVETIEEAAFALLRAQGKTFATAESCTGGGVAERFTGLPGASAYYKGGAVVYTNEAKAKLLGLDAAMIEEKGAVSYEVARDLAAHVRQKLDTDFGIGITGLAGPDGDGVHEVGTVFVSLATKDEVFVRELHLGTGRSRGFIRQMAGNHAFDMLRRAMTSLPVVPEAWAGRKA